LVYANRIAKDYNRKIVEQYRKESKDNDDIDTVTVKNVHIIGKVYVY